MIKHLFKTGTMLLAVLMLSSTAMAVKMSPVNGEEKQQVVQNQENPIIESILEKGLATPEEIALYQNDYERVFAKKYTTDIESIDSLSAFAIERANSVYLTYNEYFDDVRWIVRDGVVSLSVTPNSRTFDVSGPAQGNIAMARAFHSFSLLKDKFSSDYRWRNGDSLSAQYHCHYMFAGMRKTPWNLEPHRTESNPWSWNMIHKRCNP